MNILLIYNNTQTYTNTVYEHVYLYGKYSRNRVFYCHHDQYADFHVNLTRFDVVVIHYSLRLPFDQISLSLKESLKSYGGSKVLFIQDEYDHTHRAWHWIGELGIDLVFTCVPNGYIQEVYPSDKFPGVRFVNNLTGYVPEHIPDGVDVSPPSERACLVGYRGRSLPIRYGDLPRDKVRIGRLVKKYCESHGIAHDIAWDEESRIYGDDWYRFLASCRAMLGTESGSNVFDWDGRLDKKIADYRKSHRAGEDEVYEQVVKPLERPGWMNQVSPKVFEAIMFRTVLVLFEGNYSGVLEPGRHYIPLKKDGSNLDEVFGLLRDGDYVDAMAKRAYDDIIMSQAYSYSTFAKFVDREIGNVHDNKRMRAEACAAEMTVGDAKSEPSPLTTIPVRSAPPASFANTFGQGVGSRGVAMAYRYAMPFWVRLPMGVRTRLGPRLRRLLGVDG